MSKKLSQLSISERFVEDDYLPTTHQLLENNERHKDLVYTIMTKNEEDQDVPLDIDNKDKAYYVRTSMPYNQYSATAFLFKIRKTNEGVNNPQVLDFENDTHQVVKYAEAPYSNLDTYQGTKYIICSYNLNDDTFRRYNTYTYNQFITESSTKPSEFPENTFNNILENTSAQEVIKNYICTTLGENISTDNLKSVAFDIQELDNSGVDGSRNYIIFDFIFISKIPWNQFICSYDRRYNTDNRVLNGENSNIYVHIYPFKENSDLITSKRMSQSSEKTVSRISLRAFDDQETPLKGVPFYLNSQSLKTGPDGEYTIKDIPIYNFGIPNFNGNSGSYHYNIEYEYDSD